MQNKASVLHHSHASALVDEDYTIATSGAREKKLHP